MPGNNLSAIEHVVVLMLENRSFDHMLGFLYAGTGNVSPAGQPFEGLSGTESNPDASGSPVTVFKIEPTTPNAYFMPGADPGEGYMATNDQLFGSTAAPPTSATVPAMQGFVKDFAYTLSWQSHTSGYTIVSGTTAIDIMGCFTPEALPVLSALARGYAVCDHWYASAPTETMPNRAFACAATSQGHMDDKTHTFTCPSIFGLLSNHQLGWSIYGYDSEPLTKSDFPDITSADASHFGHFTDFTAAAAAGTLPPFTFLEPSWSSSGNSQHPNYNVALGEQFIHDVYEALRGGPGWAQTLLVITYDEHGGCYDHVPPPPAPLRRTTTPASSVSTSPGSACGCRRSWCHRSFRRGRCSASRTGRCRWITPRSSRPWSSAGTCPRSPPGTRPPPASATCSASPRRAPTTCCPG